jgi:AcrR family transcriptional regulator
MRANTLADYDEPVEQRVSQPTRGPLPPGRGALSRDEVLASQRARLLSAAAEVVAEKGYAATTVADILKRARVSRLTFYEQFTDKGACAESAYDVVAEHLMGRMGAALANGDGPMGRLDAVVRAYLEALAEEPVLARFYLVESSAAGPALRERRLATQQYAAHLIATEFNASTEGQRVACEGLVGAIVALVTSRIMTGGVESVLALQENIMNLARVIMEALPGL